MSEAHRIVALSQRARARGERLCLATVVHVEGSAYRKPGARMLLASGGERAGTISGGCLESEVSRKAWWLTSQGARVERYSSFADEDGGMPYGLGCGGTISLLLEQDEPAVAVVEALERVLTMRKAAVVVMAIGRPAGTLAVLGLQFLQSLDRPPAGNGASRRGQGLLQVAGSLEVIYRSDGLGVDLHKYVCSSGTDRTADSHSSWERLVPTVHSVFRQRQSCFLQADFQPYPVGGFEASEGAPAYFLEYLAPPPALTIFGAGDDAQPIAEFAHALGWRVTVADGRAQLARRERFPHAAEVHVLDYADPALRAACGMAHFLAVAGVSPAPGHAEQTGNHPFACKSNISNLLTDEIAVILTHSYEQDRALLSALLPGNLHYLGILGPRHRTERLLEEVAPSLGLTVDQGWARLHSPIGLDLGGGDPSAVALSIIAEIQAVLHGRRVAVTRVESAPGSDPSAAPLRAEAEEQSV